MGATTASPPDARAAASTTLARIVLEATVRHSGPAVGELTPTMKIRRAVVYERYRRELEALCS